MKPVFLDSSGLIATVNGRDSLHGEAQRIWRGLLTDRIPLVTTSLVLVELGDGLSKVRYRQLAVKLRQRLLTFEPATVLQVTDADENAGWRLFSSRDDKEWGVTDCISMEVMRRLGVSEVFSHDRDFEQAGFTLLLK